MKKLKSKSGFTLIEMVTAMAILVFLIIGMGATMDAGAQIYHEAIFEADSATLADILNTSLGDILRYSKDVKVNGVYDGDKNGTPDTFHSSDGAVVLPAQVGFFFSNREYGVTDGYFYTPLHADGSSKGVLQIRTLSKADIMDLVNTGAYPDLVITNFVITYIPAGTDGERGGYFTISYDIFSEKNTDFTRHVDTVVRLMND